MGKWEHALWIGFPLVCPSVFTLPALNVCVLSGDCDCVSTRSPGEQAVGPFYRRGKRAARRLQASAPQNVWPCLHVCEFAFTSAHVCKRTAIDLLTSDASNIPPQKMQTAPNVYAKGAHARRVFTRTRIRNRGPHINVGKKTPCCTHAWLN